MPEIDLWRLHAYVPTHTQTQTYIFWKVHIIISNYYKGCFDIISGLW